MASNGPCVPNVMDMRAMVYGAEGIRLVVGQLHHSKLSCWHATIKEGED